MQTTATSNLPILALGTLAIALALTNAEAKSFICHVDKYSLYSLHHKKEAKLSDKMRIKINYQIANRDWRYSRTHKQVKLYKSGSYTIFVDEYNNHFIRVKRYTIPMNCN